MFASTMIFELGPEPAQGGSLRISIRFYTRIRGILSPGMFELYFTPKTACHVDQYSGVLLYCGG